MSVLIAARFLAGFYEGGLKGLQRQVSLNAVRMIADALRGPGVVLILWLVSPTIEAFFIWRAFVSVMEAAAMAILLKRFMPPAPSPGRFRVEVVRNVWKFATGLFAITLTSVLLLHADKIILSKVLPLSLFGYYILAGNVARVLYSLVYPVTTATRPRLAQLIGGGDLARLREVYHSACQVLSVLTLPIAILIALFARELLWAWTGSASIADQTHVVLTLLILGICVHSLMHLPYALQVASGWLRLCFTVDLIVGIVQLVAMLVVGPLFGAYGIAVVFVFAQALRTTLHVVYMHRRLLPGERLRWLIRDVGLPLCGTLAVLIVARVCIPPQLSRFGYTCVLATMWVAAAGGAAMLAPKVRPQLVRLLRGALPGCVRRALHRT